MRISLFLTCFIFMIAGPALKAAAQTPISKEAANNFYASCIAKETQQMKAESQEAMCACNAAMMVKNMTVEEVQTMKENTQAGRDALNKMLLDVYAPCMNYPVHDMVERNCLRNKNIDKAGIDKSQEEICFCAAKKTAEWFAKEGRALMRTILSKQPNIYDPIEPVMNSNTFQSQAYGNMMSCLTEE